MHGKQAVGVDGCRGGWLCFAIGSCAREITIEVLPDFGKVRKLFSQAVLAVDIPIGLPRQGARRCDVAARKLIETRRSSVFPAPIRAMLAAETYENACEIGRRIDGRALSRQCFAILSKIREVDTELSSKNLLTTIVEVHPEVCFWALNGRKYLEHSKRHSAGRRERLMLLKRIYPGIEQMVFDKRLAQVDDLYDAAAAAWTAERIIKQQAKVVSDAEVDSCGLTMQITY